MDLRSQHLSTSMPRIQSLEPFFPYRKYGKFQTPLDPPLVILLLKVAGHFLSV